VCSGTLRNGLPMDGWSSRRGEDAASARLSPNAGSAHPRAEAGYRSIVAARCRASAWLMIVTGAEIACRPTVQASRAGAVQRLRPDVCQRLAERSGCREPPFETLGLSPSSGDGGPPITTERAGGAEWCLLGLGLD
jgi:hypothetical protein